MYYEIYGNNTDIPVILLHGGGSTIQSTFGKVILILSKNRTDKSQERMVNFKDVKDQDLETIKAETLILSGDHDFSEART